MVQRIYKVLQINYDYCLTTTTVLLSPLNKLIGETKLCMYNSNNFIESYCYQYGRWTYKDGVEVLAGHSGPVERNNSRCDVDGKAFVIGNWVSVDEEVVRDAGHVWPSVVTTNDRCYFDIRAELDTITSESLLSLLLKVVPHSVTHRSGPLRNTWVASKWSMGARLN